MVAVVKKEAFARNRQMSTAESCGDEINNPSNSSHALDRHQVVQLKPLRNILAANLLRNTWKNGQNANSELQRRRNFPVLREGLVQNGRRTRLGSFRDRTMCRTWLGRRYFNSESKRTGLSESQIGLELLSEVEEQPSTGLQICLNPIDWELSINHVLCIFEGLKLLGSADLDSFGNVLPY